MSERLHTSPDLSAIETTTIAEFYSKFPTLMKLVNGKLYNVDELPRDIEFLEKGHGIVLSDFGNVQPDPDNNQLAAIIQILNIAARKLCQAPQPQTNTGTPVQSPDTHWMDYINLGSLKFSYPEIYKLATTDDPIDRGVLDTERDELFANALINLEECGAMIATSGLEDVFKIINAAAHKINNGTVNYISDSTLPPAPKDPNDWFDNTTPEEDDDEEEGDFDTATGWVASLAELSFFGGAVGLASRASERLGLISKRTRIVVTVVFGGGAALTALAIGINEYDLLDKAMSFIGSPDTEEATNNSSAERSLEEVIPTASVAAAAHAVTGKPIALDTDTEEAARAREAEQAAQQAADQAAQVAREEIARIASEEAEKAEEAERNELEISSDSSWIEISTSFHIWKTTETDQVEFGINCKPGNKISGYAKAPEEEPKIKLSGVDKDNNETPATFGDKTIENPYKKCKGNTGKAFVITN
ncbi:hypothetical protein HOD30_03100 [Candidatus Peregrinibacteria bacterium]|nr:hypothetical protein [Candidatus Peregrinibacteria bacterium]MBT4632080.1 hypothetical protein [Candidatus Peregrinibacteria bacterium]